MEGLTDEERLKLVELDMAEMRQTVERICEGMAILEKGQIDYFVRVFGLATAIEKQVPEAARATFAAVAIEMLAKERTERT